MQVVDSAAMFLLNLFLEEPQVLNKHKAQLKLMFGVVTPALADNICTVIYNLFTSVLVRFKINVMAVRSEITLTGRHSGPASLFSV